MGESQRGRRNQIFQIVFIDMQTSEREPLQMKVKRRVSAPPRPRETETPIAEVRPEVETASAQPTTPLISPATKPLTNVVRPRAQSLSEEHLPQPATSRTQKTTVPVVRSVPAPEKESSAQPSELKAVVSTAKATAQPRTAERQAAVQRLVVGTALDARMTAAGIHVTDLDDKAGLQQMLSATLRTPGEEVKVAAFLKEMTSMPDAEELPASSLNLLYTRTNELKGNEGLKEFAVTSLIKAENEQDVSQFLDDLKGTDGVQLSADRLAQIYAVRADVMGKPGLKGFLIKAHTDKQNINDLNEFVDAYKGSAAADLDASKLRFLFDQRAVLKPNPGLNDFAVEALGKGESTDSLTPFLAESKDPRVAALKKEQVSLLYKNYIRVKDEPELKELVIDKLATTVDWEAGLNRFLEAMGPLNTKPLKSQQLDFIYGLGDDLKATITDRPIQGLNTNLAVFAVDQFSNQATASGAPGAISDLKAFGYKGGFLDAARTGAKKLGEAKYNQALKALNADEQKAIDAVPKQFVAPVKPAIPRPAKSLSKKDQRAQKPLIEQWDQYDAAKETFDTEVPGKISAETKRLKASYKQQRDDLAKDKEANFVAPEFGKNQQYASSAGFSDDAQWALKLTGDSEQAQILFLACKDTTQPALKPFGEWAVAKGFTGEKLQSLMDVAKDLNVDLAKLQAVAPFIAECSDPATQSWLKTRVANKTTAELSFEVELLGAHKDDTLSLATQAIDGAPADGPAKTKYNTLLKNYNRYLAKPGLGEQILRLFEDRSMMLSSTEKIVKVYAERGGLDTMLEAADPLPAGYASLDDICKLVKPDPQQTTGGNDIDDVEFALKDNTRIGGSLQVNGGAGVGRPYVEHVLTRIKEGSKKADIKFNNHGYKEWLMVSRDNWGLIEVQCTPFKANPGAKTGIFTMTIDGVAIEVHNHFKNGSQYSLHLKDGKGTLEKGPELTPKDVSVFGTISNTLLARYNVVAQGKRDAGGGQGWPDYNI